MGINFKAGRAIVQQRRQERARFDALPLIEQIREVVRQEVRSALAERAQWDSLAQWEKIEQQAEEARRLNNARSKIMRRISPMVAQSQTANACVVDDARSINE